MECRKVIACLLTLLLATVLFTISAGAQGLTSGEAKTPTTTKGGYSLEDAIAKHPLKASHHYSKEAGREFPSLSAMVIGRSLSLEK